MGTRIAFRGVVRLSLALATLVVSACMPIYDDRMPPSLEPIAEEQLGCADLDQYELRSGTYVVTGCGARAIYSRWCQGFRCIWIPVTDIHPVWPPSRRAPSSTVVASCAPGFVVEDGRCLPVCRKGESDCERGRCVEAADGIGVCRDE